MPHRQVVLTIPKRLRAWCLYISSWDQARQSSLAPITDAHAAGALPAKEVALAVERSVLEGWLMAVRDVRTNEVLQTAWLDGKMP